LTVSITLAVPAGLNSIVGPLVGDVNWRTDEFPPPLPPLLPLLLLLEFAFELEHPDSPQSSPQTNKNSSFRLVATQIPSGDRAPAARASTGSWDD